MSARSDSRPAWLVAVLAGVGLAFGAMAPAHAQIDDADLRAQIIDLQASDNQQKVEIVALQIQLKEADEALARLRLDMTKVQGDVAKLAAEVATLRKDPPDPSKPQKPADGQSLTLRAPFIVKDGAGRVVFQVDIPPDRALPRVIVGNPAASHVEMGPTIGGGAALALIDDSKKMLTVLTGDPKGSYLRLRDNEQMASLGKIEDKGLGLFLSRGEKDVAELLADKAGAGNLRMFGASGKPVAGLFSDKDGARLALTAAAGGNSAISLAVTPSGGKVRVFSAHGGPARAELTADNTLGAVNIFDSEGKTAVTIASVASKAGLLQISNGSGSIVVEAGAEVKSGRGRVSTGPYDAGAAGTIGGGLKAASSIVGSTTAK